MPNPLDLHLDTEQFYTFLAHWENYKKQVAEMPEHWAKAEDHIGTATNA